MALLCTFLVHRFFYIYIIATHYTKNGIILLLSLYRSGEIFFYVYQLQLRFHSQYIANKVQCVYSMTAFHNGNMHIYELNELFVEFNEAADLRTMK